MSNPPSCNCGKQHGRSWCRARRGEHTILVLVAELRAELQETRGATRVGQGQTEVEGPGHVAVVGLEGLCLPDVQRGDGRVVRRGVGLDVLGVDGAGRDVGREADSRLAEDRVEPIGLVLLCTRPRQAVVERGLAEHVLAPAGERPDVLRLGAVLQHVFDAGVRWTEPDAVVDLVVTELVEDPLDHHRGVVAQTDVAGEVHAVALARDLIVAKLEVREVAGAVLRLEVLRAPVERGGTAADQHADAAGVEAASGRAGELHLTVVVLERVVAAGGREEQGRPRDSLLGDQVHGTADGVTVHVGRQRLRHFNGLQLVGGHRIECHLPQVALGCRHALAVDHHRVQPGLGPADEYVATLALVTGNRHAGNA